MHIEQTTEFPACLLQRTDMLKSELDVQMDAGLALGRDAREQRMETVVPRKLDDPALQLTADSPVAIAGMNIQR